MLSGLKTKGRDPSKRKEKLPEIRALIDSPLKFCQTRAYNRLPKFDKWVARHQRRL